MGRKSVHPFAKRAWALAAAQQDCVTRVQLLGIGMSADAIDHRLTAGRLHPLWPGVYAVGRPSVSRLGRWMGAVLASGPGAVLSHESAAALWRIRKDRFEVVEVSVPAHRAPRHRGIRIHRRRSLETGDVTEHRQIPVTTPICTLVDIASRLSSAQLEAAVNAADKLELVDLVSLRSRLEEFAGRPGIRPLRNLLDRRTFVLTDSELERYFLPLARGVGLPKPETGLWLNGFEVDFFYRELGLVVETDGLRYHRTPAQQARDRCRDQAHMAAGLTPLRFTHEQVKYGPAHVTRILTAVAAQCRARARLPGL